MDNKTVREIVQACALGALGGVLGAIMAAAAILLIEGAL